MGGSIQSFVGALQCQVGLVVRIHLHFGQFDVSENSGQDIVEIVGDATGQGADTAQFFHVL